MSRAAVGVLVLTLAMLAGLVAWGAGWWRGERESRPARPISATTSVTPAQAFFGDRLSAALDVIVDPARVDPDHVRVRAAFSPYRAVRTSRSSRKVGGAVELGYRYTLACLEATCLPRRRLFSFAHAVIVYDGAKVLRAAWPAVDVASRLRAVNAQGAPLADRKSLVSPSYRISPGLLAGLALGFAGILVLGAGVLIMRAVPRRRPAPPPPRVQTPLEQALAAVREAVEHGDSAARRKALERLARVLEQRVDGYLPQEVRRVAWSQAPPAARDVAELARRAEDAAGEEQ
jgi:hypothetical protein